MCIRDSYGTPYDAYINYMNVLADFRLTLDAASPLDPGTKSAVLELSLIHILYCCRLLRNHCSWAGGNCVFPAVSIPASFIRAGMSILRKWTPENGLCSVTVSER